MALPIKKKALIKTERLIIKPFSSKDVDGLVNLLLNPEITKTFMVPKFESVEQMKNLAEKLIDFSREEDTTHLEYGIYLNGKIIDFYKRLRNKRRRNRNRICHSSRSSGTWVCNGSCAGDYLRTSRNGLSQGDRRLQPAVV